MKDSYRIYRNRQKIEIEHHRKDRNSMSMGDRHIEV